jgi:hypothetical protein
VTPELPLLIPRRRAQRSATFLLVGSALIVSALVAAIGPADAAQVSGVFKGYESAAPRKDVYLRLENEITRDSYIVQTANDGSFGAELPPGVYRLRGERGAILARPFVVDVLDVNLGQVSDLAPYAFARLFQLQYLAPSILVSPAPATTDLMTGETTMPLPPEVARPSERLLPAPPAPENGVE